MIRHDDLMMQEAWRRLRLGLVALRLMTLVGDAEVVEKDGLLHPPFGQALASALGEAWCLCDVA